MIRPPRGASASRPSSCTRGASTSNAHDLCRGASKAERPAPIRGASTMDASVSCRGASTRRRSECTGLSLVELAIVAVILSIMVVAYFTLSRQETVSTRMLQDRARATALARNLVCLVRNGHNRAWLDEAGMPGEDGSYTFPASTIPNAEHAFGPALMDWVDARGVEASVNWYPDTGEGEDSPVGRVVCTVSWTREDDQRSSISLPGVLQR